MTHCNESAESPLACGASHQRRRLRKVVVAGVCFLILATLAALLKAGVDQVRETAARLNST